MSETSMVERVAKVLKPEWFTVIDGVCALDNYPDQHKRYQEDAREQARAVLAAMRELTDDMVKAGIEADDKRTGNQTIRHIHRAMIDAALKSTPKAG